MSTDSSTCSTAQAAAALLGIGGALLFHRRSMSTHSSTPSTTQAATALLGIIIASAILFYGLRRRHRKKGDENCSIEVSRDEACARTCASDDDKAPPVSSNLYEDIESMLYISYIIQDIALFNHWDDIIGGGRLNEAEFFKTLPRTLSQVLEWFKTNMPTLRRAEEKTLRKMDPSFDLEGLEAIMAQQKRAPTPHDGEEATIEVFNDEFGFHWRDSKPVYGIARNPKEKRLTLVFRGSVSPRDWAQDAKVQEKEVPLTPEEIRLIVPNPDEMLLMHGFQNVKVHVGFHEYLFEMEHNNRTKFDEVVEEVMKLVDDPRNKGYTLYVTGHSLGGALATLAATCLALSNDVAMPVKLITFASPHVGKADFAKALTGLEEASRLHHLRITNDDDMVPQGLAVLGYIHSGIHISLSKDTHRLAPSSQDKFSPLDINFSPNWLLGNPSHQMQEHKKRLDQAKKELTSRTFDGLFVDAELRSW